MEQQYVDNSWDTYQFEVQKYIEKMSNNPYVGELEQLLLDEKKKKLVEHLGDEYADLFITNIINLIYSKFNTNSSFEQFTRSFIIEFKDTVNLDVNGLKKFIDNLNINTSKINYKLAPSKLRISTMTICCSIGSPIDTRLLYDTFDPPKDILNTDPTIVGKYKSDISECIIGCKSDDFVPKGYFEKKKKTNFFNSAAINMLITPNKPVNIKVFNNGKLQMTGIPSNEKGFRAAEIIIEYIKSIPETDKKLVSDKKRLSVTDYRTVLINSDYNSGIEIERENLYHILRNRYSLSVSYESENYPGVKLEYFWNTKNSGKTTEGQCVCSNKCIGKGSGNGDMDCKKVTVSTFQSGKVIVTGARSTDQLNDAYNYINMVFEENYDYIKKTKKVFQNNYKNDSKNRTMLIKKSDILNFNMYETLVKSY